jgi:hypothetical protein
MTRLVALFALAAGLAGAAPTEIRLEGRLTNLTGDDTSARARVELRLDGEKASARIVTEEPLTGTGELSGRMAGGWLELSGTLEGGLKVVFRGALSPRDYRGTYIAAVPGDLVQYGRFDLDRAPPTPAGGAGKR